MAFVGCARPDPEAAIAALAAKPDCANNAFRSIGEFHPEWRMKHSGVLADPARRIGLIPPP